MSQSAVNISRPILVPSTFFSTLCDSEVFVFALKYAICRETYGFAYFFVIHFCVILYTYLSYSMHDELVKSVCGMCGRSCRLLVMQYIWCYRASVHNQYLYTVYLTFSGVRKNKTWEKNITKKSTWRYLLAPFPANDQTQWRTHRGLQHFGFIARIE